MIIKPPVGKSGPEINCNKSSILQSLFVSKYLAAAITSLRLCGAKLQASATAIPDVPFTKTVGKYGKNVNFDYRFNLKTFYQLFVDGEYEHVVLADYFKYHSSYWVSFSEQTYFNKIKVEENTNIYFDRDDFSLMKIIQNTSFYSEGNMTKSETKILSSIVYDQNYVMDKSSDEYVDLSGTCLPNVEF